MTCSFPDAMVTGYETLLDGMTNDPKDRHVLAAAVRTNGEVVVTFNMRDFPEPALKSYDILAVHPDDFLLDQLDLYPASPSTSLSSRRPPIDANPPPSRDCCRCLNARAYPQFTAEVRRHIG